MLKDRELIIWPAGKEKIIEKTVGDFLGILKVDRNGEVRTTRSFELGVYRKILSSYVAINGIDSSQDVSHLIYRAVFNRLKHYQRQDLAGFRKALAAEARKFLKRPINTYSILLPLHMRPTELQSTRSISIFGVKLLVRNWLFCRRKFELDEFIRATRLHLKDSHFEYFGKFNPIIVSSQGKYVQEAFLPVERSFDFLRWLINLQYQYGRTTRRWGGIPKPLGKILPPPTYAIFRSDGSYETMFYSLRRYEDYSANSLAPQILPQVRRISRILGGLNHSSEIQTILVEAIALYGEALDAFDWRHSFLTLWQILEIITLQSEDNLSMKTVRNRVSGLLYQQGLFKDLLDASYQIRNSLVHRGSFPDESGLEEVNLLKIIVERSINRLFSLVRVCKTKESLERYYQHIFMPSSELTDRRRIIRNILDTRK